MEFTSSIASLLVRSTYPTPATEHRWNHLLGVELELENVTVPGGGSLYDDIDFDPSYYTGEDEWDELSYEEQDDIREVWYATNSKGCPTGWTLHNDASLRNGLEFVTSPAVLGTDMEERLDSFFNKPLNYDGGPRTSTHVHINILNDNPCVLQSLLMLVYAIEDSLYNIVDEGRKWAGYSMALAEMPPTRLRNLLNPPTSTHFVRAINVTQNRDRYYGFNFNVARHGTVEFRYFPGAPTKQELTEWIDLVVLLKNTAIKYTPEQLIGVCSDPTNMALFLTNNLGYWGQRLLNAGGSANIFRSFEEVATMCTDDANPERQNSVVKLQEPLYTLIVDNLLGSSEEAKSYLTKAGMPTGIMSIDDAIYYVGSAKALADAATRKEKKSKVTANTLLSQDEYRARVFETINTLDASIYSPTRRTISATQRSWPAWVGTTPTTPTTIYEDPF